MTEIPFAKLPKQLSQAITAEVQGENSRQVIDLTTEDENCRPGTSLEPSLGLSGELQASLASVSSPVVYEHQRPISFHILHPYLRYVEVLKEILESRAETGESQCVQLNGSGRTLASGGGGGGRKRSCVCVGSLTFGLKGCLDMGRVFREGSHTLILAFVEVKTGWQSEWMIQLKLRGGVWFLPITAGPCISQSLFEVFASPACLMRFFLPQSGSNEGVVDSLEIELWATEKICNFDDPSSPNHKLVNGKKESIHWVLKTLCPKFSLEEEEEGLFGW